MFGFFKKRDEKNELAIIKHAVQTGFNSVKNDVNTLTRWIKHLNSNDELFKNDINTINDDIFHLKDEIENIKNLLSLVGNPPILKQNQTMFNKQTPSISNLNVVQTSVQSSFLYNLTTNERAIIFVLLNSDMKLSYEDLAAMLGKNKSTIRGQINSIKRKSEGLLEENIGENSKKRVYIPEKIKEILFKMKKVRDKVRKLDEKNDEIE